MLKKIERWIKTHSLICNEERILACVSGGVDSMVMLDVLLKLYPRNRVGVAHCNFGLRGQEADKESDMVIKYCSDRNIECFVSRFDTMAQMVSGESIQMAARRLRYDFFDQIALEKKFDRIAIAHNFDDKIETFFINLTRGAGVRGLKGIAVINGKIIRPLLCATRLEISDYATDNEIFYYNDSSNDEDKYLRNKIRHSIVPILREVSSFDVAMERVFDNLSSESEFLERYVKEKLDQVGDAVDVNDIDKYLIYRYLDRYGFGGDVVKQVCVAIDKKESGKRFFSSTHVALLDRDRLVVESLVEDELVAFKFNTYEENFSESKNYASGETFAYFDSDKLSRELKIRRVENGDWFVPYGMRGRKLLSDFFKDSGVNLLDRSKAFVLCSGEDIVWVVGKRTDDRFKVDSSCERVLRVELIW